MISLILLTKSKSSVELASSALRDQAQPTGNEEPPTSKMLEEELELLVVSTASESRTVEMRTAQRLGDRADSKDAKLLKAFWVQHVEMEADFSVKEGLLTALPRCKGDFIIILPDMPYFHQGFIWSLYEAHKRLKCPVVIPRLKIRTPVFVNDTGKAVGRDGRERHSRLGPDSCGPVGFVLDNDCDEILKDDHGDLFSPIYCAAFAKTALKNVKDAEEFFLNGFIVENNHFTTVSEYVIHLELPWNPRLNDYNAKSASRWAAKLADKKRLPKLLPNKNKRFRGLRRFLFWV